MLIIRKYDFDIIKDIVTAAECLQQAGKDKECEEVLLTLARDLSEREANNEGVSN